MVEQDCPNNCNRTVSFYLGSTAFRLGSPTYTFTGTSTADLGTPAAAGDTDGDGYGDAICAAPSLSKVHVYLGGLSNVTEAATLNSTGSFGFYVSTSYQ
jgi:hypothetical protein